MPKTPSSLRSELRRISSRISDAEKRLGALRTALRESAATLRRLGERFSRRPPVGRRRGPAAAEVRRIRHRLGLSQVKFAKALGVSKVAVFFWESGRRKPSERSFGRIHALLKRTRR